MREHGAGSVLLRIKPWLESGGPFRPGGENAAGPPPEASFSALDLRDRVVVQLLQDEVVDEKQVAAAWRRWKSAGEATPDALWRVVARQPAVEAEAVFASAARVYAFAPADSILYRSRALLRSRRGRFSLRQRRRLTALAVLPVKIDETANGTPRWVFATHDPARPAVHTLLADLDVPAYELRYAPAAAVRARLEDAFPGAAALNAPAAFGLPAAAEGPPSASFFSGRPGSAREVPAKQGRPPARRGRETVRTFAGIYEELLAGAARSGAARVRLTATRGDGRADSLVATFDYDGQEASRRVSLAVPPEAVFSFMRRRVRSARREAPPSGVARVTHRWVKGRRCSFRLAALPERRAYAAGHAEIVIQVVK